MKTTVALLALALCAGCVKLHNYVVSATGTVIGLEIAENPQTQLYQAKLGYARTELALLPTNKGETNSFMNGAKDVPDVIMEVRYNNMFSFGSAGIYQRLAVGDVAVRQPGAAFMFAKSKDGTLDPATANAVSTSFTGVTNAPSAAVVQAALPLAQAYQASSVKAKFDAAAQQQGWANFVAFLVDKTLTLNKVQAMQVLLKAQGLL
jgi:hypothetical protein